jgi:hypothetical protein
MFHNPRSRRPVDIFGDFTRSTLLKLCTCYFEIVVAHLSKIFSGASSLGED